MSAFQSTMSILLQLAIASFLLLTLPRTSESFSPQSAKTSAVTRRSPYTSSSTSIFFFGNNGKEGSQEGDSKAGSGFATGFFQDIKGMMDNIDDVVDDFVYKRMGAGEQWYGKRKYNPSGKFDGDYNGMGRSDQFRIELARVQKEEMEKRRQRRLAEEEERKRNQMS